MNFKGFDGSCRGLIEVLSWNIPEGNEENYKPSSQPVSRLRFESSISEYQSIFLFGINTYTVELCTIFIELCGD